MQQNPDNSCDAAGEKDKGILFRLTMTGSQLLMTENLFFDAVNIRKS